jgi:hypothetical protein
LCDKRAAIAHLAEGGAERSLSGRRGSRSSFRVALPPCEARGSGLAGKFPRRAMLELECSQPASQFARFGVNFASPSPKVMPHETSRFDRHHSLALHFAPRSYLSARI